MIFAHHCEDAVNNEGDNCIFFRSQRGKKDEDDPTNCVFLGDMMKTERMGGDFNL